MQPCTGCCGWRGGHPARGTRSRWNMFRLLGGGVAGDLVGLPRSQLAVLPGTTHVTLLDRADWLISMVTVFLDASVPKAK